MQICIVILINLGFLFNIAFNNVIESCIISTLGVVMPIALALLASRTKNANAVNFAWAVTLAVLVAFPFGRIIRRVIVLRTD